MTIGRRLTVAFSSIGFIIACGAGIASWQFALVLQQTRRLAAVDNQALTVYRVRADVGAIRRRLDTSSKQQDRAGFDNTSRMLRQDLLHDVEESLTYFRETGTPVPATLGALRDALTDQLDAIDGLVEVEDWTAIQLRLDNQIDEILSGVRQMVDYVDSDVSEQRLRLLNQIDAVRQSAVIALGATALISLGASLGLGWYVTRSIVVPLSQLRVAANRFASGDFNVALDFNSDDELGEVRDAFKLAGRELHQSYLALQRSNEDLEQFAFAASHDLQEPIRTISLFCDLLKSRHADALPPKAKTYVDRLSDAASRMRELVNGILEYSRLAGNAVGQLERIETEKIIEAVVTNLHAIIKQTHAEVKHDAVPAVKGRPLQVLQLFQNLITNAIKYRKEGVSPRVHISAQKENGFWRFCVADNGIGIDPRYREKVFGIFQQLNPGERGGAGVGLATTKRIVERHGGTIFLESNIGEGCRFYFTLPADQNNS